MEVQSVFTLFGPPRPASLWAGSHMISPPLPGYLTLFPVGQRNNTAAAFFLAGSPSSLPLCEQNKTKTETLCLGGSLQNNLSQESWHQK